MGHVPGSRAATGIAMAIFVGFGLTTAPFLTSSSTALLTYTLLPDQARNGLDWAGWALRAAPVYLVLMAGLISGLIWLYRPEPVAPDAPSVDSARRRSRVALQSALLGRPSQNEQLSGIVVLLLVAGFLTGPIHHIPPTWLALAAVLLLAVVGVVTTESIRSVNWNLLVLFGVIASVQPVFAGTRVNEWLGAVLVGPLQHLVSAPVLFVTALTLVGVLISFMLRTPTAAPLMTVAFGPVAMAAGIDAWIVALVALVSCTIFIFAYQSNPYQALLQGTGGRLFTDAQTRPLAILYVLLSLIAVCVSVPIWHVMGLL
jgi:sodium-dependent dicarboxylate transporter 2/3/5